jgi:hypothetical protein
MFHTSALDAVGQLGRLLAAAPVPEPADTDLVDTLAGALMMSVAVGIIAIFLIAISRRREQAVPLAEALMTPAAVVSLGAAVLNLWVAPELLTAYPPAGLLTLLLAGFQAESAFALSRPRYRRGATRAAILINAVAVLASVVAHLAGPPVGPTAGVPESWTGLGLATLAFEAGLVLMLGVAIRWGSGAAAAVRRLKPAMVVEIRSVVVATVTMLTFLALAGQGHGHG